MPQFEVKIPIAGHAVVSVEAKDRDDAIEKAIALTTIDDVEEWEALTQFHEGNFCYCPKPWEVAVFNEDGEELEE